MKSTRRERRDLILVILILPIGIVCMLVVGQLAISLLPPWNIAANMGSNVNPNMQYASLQEVRVVEPLLSGIQTQPAWRDTFLTPQAGQDGGYIVPLATFDPSLTPSPQANVSQTAAVSPTVIASSTPVPTDSATPTSVTVTATVSGTPPTVTATKTKKPDQTDIAPTSTAPVTVTVTATATTATPTDTVTVTTTVTATSTSTATVTTTVTATTTATATGTTSTPPPGSTKIAPPVQVEIGAPNGSISWTADNSYYVLNLPVVVNGPSDKNYDLVYYEMQYPFSSPGYIRMDQVIVGITNDNTGSSYYQVFNWGDGVPDTNTNVDTSVIGVNPAEVDNQIIPMTDLHQDSAASPQTGITIDVDNAPSNPPPDTYNYVVIVAPPTPPPPAPAGDGGQTDSVQVTEVSPTP
jgi:hypothetical protein